MICPRKDGDVIPVDECIKQMSELHGVNYMNIYGAFTYNDGSVETHFYYRDGGHLNNTGTSEFDKSRCTNYKAKYKSTTRYKSNQKCSKTPIYKKPTSIFKRTDQYLEEPI